MLTARCVARGSRIVGSDVTGGLYTDYEVAEFTNTPMEITEEGEITIIKKDAHKEEVYQKNP